MELDELRLICLMAAGSDGKGGFRRARDLYSGHDSEKLIWSPVPWEDGYIAYESQG